MQVKNRKKVEGKESTYINHMVLILSNHENTLDICRRMTDRLFRGVAVACFLQCNLNVEEGSGCRRLQSGKVKAFSLLGIKKEKSAVQRRILCYTQIFKEE